MKILHSMITIVLLVNTPIYVIVEVRSYIPKYKQSAIARFILVSLTPISLGSDNSLEKTIPIKCSRFEQGRIKYYRMYELNMKGTKVK